jgi:hypothetical protein
VQSFTNLHFHAVGFSWDELLLFLFFVFLLLLFTLLFVESLLLLCDGIRQVLAALENYM